MCDVLVCRERHRTGAHTSTYLTGSSPLDHSFGRWLVVEASEPFLNNGAGVLDGLNPMVADPVPFGGGRWWPLEHIGAPVHLPLENQSVPSRQLYVPCMLQNGIIEKEDREVSLVFIAALMINRSGWGSWYSVARGEIL